MTLKHELPMSVVLNLKTNNVVKFPTSRIHNGLIRVNIEKLQEGTKSSKLQESMKKDIAKTKEDGTKSSLKVPENTKKDSKKLIKSYSDDSSGVCSPPSSPRISPSSFLNPKSKNKAHYERKLLKKKHEDVKKENETEQTKSSEEKTFWKKVKNSTIRASVKRHHSFSHRPKKSQPIERGYESSSEIKLRTSNSLKLNQNTEKGYLSASPKFLHKLRNASFNRRLKNVENQTSVNDSTETETETETSIKRNVQHRRRKSQTSTTITDGPTIPDNNVIDNKQNEELKNEYRLSKFRRRKQSDSVRLKYRRPSRDNLSKVLLLYSGNINDRYNFENYPDLFFKEESRSGGSDIENDRERMQKPSRGVARKVWRSINNIIQLPNDNSKGNFNDFNSSDSRPLSNCKRSHSFNISKSYPGALHKNDVKISFINSYSTDNLYNSDCLKEGKNNSIKDKDKLKSIKRQKSLTLEKSIYNIQVKQKRSKSLEDLETTHNNNRMSDKGNSTIENKKVSRKKSFIEALRRNSVSKSYNSNKTNSSFKIIVSQDPKESTENDTVPHQNESTDVVSSLNLAELRIADSNINDKANHKRTRLLDLKMTLKQELESFLHDKVFDPSQVNKWCRILAESIKDRVILLTEENHKIITQIFIGALIDHGIHAAIQSTSDKSKDGFFAVTYRGKDLFAIASLLTFEVS